MIAYLSAIAAGHVVALLDAGLAAPLRDALISRFEPGIVLRPGSSRAVQRRPGEPPEIHRELAVMLSTSGTTGSPKFVRLSMRNLTANALSIADYLSLDGDERPIVSLPIHYSYGLSVVNSHLLVGATLVFSPHSVIRPEFWLDFAAQRCSSFAGVPYAYSMLERTGWRERPLPTLRTMTQAGGRMPAEMALRFHEHLASRDASLVVMYGQTEATARIAYVPPAFLPAKAGSIGIPIPGGELTVVDGDGEPVPTGAVGELCYRGPNVMLGYASAPADLARGDELGGRLLTGDLGFVDGDGFHFVNGRSKRIAKVFGLRVNLDEVEAALPHDTPVAAVAGSDQIVIFRLGAGAGGDGDGAALARSLAREFGLNPRAFSVRTLRSMPQLDSGKVDYAALGALADDR